MKRSFVTDSVPRRPWQFPSLSCQVWELEVPCIKLEEGSIAQASHRKLIVDYQTCIGTQRALITKKSEGRDNLFCMSKCAMTRGRDIHSYGTRGRDTYRTGSHRTGVYEHLPSQAGVRFLNKLPNSIKNAPTPKALKARLKRFLASQAFYSADEFMAFDWVTAQLEH
ncbi:hypothetical protein J6590_059264 [Homalodisca vitripennis]|nr:hypothetical protein J6590_059264 [Homalodisca vitripennis]